MFIDTHCHVNMMIKTTFDTPLKEQEFIAAGKIVAEAAKNNVEKIINVGTSLVESHNCIELSKRCSSFFSSVGIHPNDVTASWRKELEELIKYIPDKKNKIVAVGECGLDFHYKNYNVQRQKDAFKAQIEYALEQNIALIVHTRHARDETLRSLEEFKNQIAHGVIHCFSEDQDFANTVVNWGFMIGINGTVTYPKNDRLRKIVRSLSLKKMVLETDAPFLAPQIIRGKKNHPLYIHTIAEYVAALRGDSCEYVEQQTTINAENTFQLTS